MSSIFSIERLSLTAYSHQITMLRQLLLIAFAALLRQANAQSPGEAACNYIKGYASTCAQGYSNFAQLPFTIAASCLCYEPTAWNPDNYDQAFKTCGNYIRTASPDAFLTLTSVGGPLPTAPCRDAGNVRNYPEKDVRLLACQQIQNVFAGCAQTYSGFMTAAPFLQQSPCLCYRDGNPNAYVGDVYDSKASECLDYLETANAQGYASAVAANGGKWVPPCQSALDAKTSRSIPGPASSTTPPRPADSPSPVVVVSTTTRPPTTLSTTTQPPAPIVESPSTPEPLPSTESIKERKSKSC